MKATTFLLALCFLVLTEAHAQNVGIGTSSPTQTLHVYTTTNGGGILTDCPTSPTTSAGYLLGIGGVQKAAMGIAGGSGAFSLDAVINDLVIRTVPASGAAYGRILFNTNGGSGNSTMVVDSSYVGIGMNGGHPGTLLQVGTYTTVSATGFVAKTVLMSQDGGYGQVQVTNPATTGNPESTIGFVNEVTAIGASPTSAIGDSAIWAIGVNSYQPGGNSNKFVIGNKATGDLGTGHGALMVVQPNGLVGIGTTTPSYNLDISGTLRSTTSAYFASSSGNVMVGQTSNTPYQSLTVTNASDIITGGGAGETSTHALGLETGQTTSDYILYMGADKTNHLGYIQAVNYGVAVTNLGLNTRGGYVGIGTTTPLGALDVTSTTGALVPPRMTTTQQNALSNPPTGSVIFNTTTNTLNVNTGTAAAPVWTSSGTSAHTAYAFTSSTTLAQIQTNTTLTVGSYKFYLNFTPGTCNTSYIEVENSTGTSYAALYYENQQWTAGNNFNDAVETTLTNGSYVALPDNGNCIGSWSSGQFGNLGLLVYGDPAYPMFRITVGSYTGTASGVVSLSVEKLN